MPETVIVNFVIASSDDLVIEESLRVMDSVRNKFQNMGVNITCNYTVTEPIDGFNHNVFDQDDPENF